MTEKWYAVPGYGPHSPTVVNAAGELICTCETLEDAERIAEDHNPINWHDPINWHEQQSLPDNVNRNIERGGTG